MIKQLYSASSGAGGSFTVQSDTEKLYGLVGINAGASATGVFAVQGRFTTGGTWQTIASIDSTTPSRIVTLFPFMQVVKSSGSDNDVFLRY